MKWSICTGWFIALVLIAQLVALPSAAARLKFQTSWVDPCTIDDNSPAARTHVRISREVANHVVVHLRNACALINKSVTNGSPFAPAHDRLRSTASSIHVNLLEPIYRAHPRLRWQSTVQVKASVHGTRHNISRRTAVWLDDAFTRLSDAVGAATSPIISESSGRENFDDVRHAMMDIVHELWLADRVTYEAYPDLWQKKLEATFKQTPPRTEESDTNFRKSAPPRGTVRLSDAAIKIVRDFMSSVQKEAPKEDQVAAITWALDSESKGPNDKEWKKLGPGLSFGGYARKQVPPDVIDHVDGVDIVFSASDPAMLAGKTIDFRNGKFVIEE
jgi:hypothetical protein